VTGIKNAKTFFYIYDRTDTLTPLCGLYPNKCINMTLTLTYPGSVMQLATRHRPRCPSSVAGCCHVFTPELFVRLREF